MDAAGVHSELIDQSVAAVLRVDDDGIKARVEPALRAALAGPGLARKDVVRREHQRTAGREQVPVEMLDG